MCSAIPDVVWARGLSQTSQDYLALRHSRHLNFEHLIRANLPSLQYADHTPVAVSLLVNIAHAYDRVSNDALLRRV